MIFSEKLSKLTEERDKRKLSLEAGLPPTAVSNYISKANTPRSDTALKLARLLNVPLEWLVDDAMEFPVPPELNPAAPSASMLSDDELMGELAIRYRRAILALLSALDRAKTVDWMGAVRHLQQVPHEAKDLPDEVTKPLCALVDVEVRVARMLQDFDLDFYAILHHKELPGADRRATDLTNYAASSVYDTLLKTPAPSAFADLINSRTDLDLRGRYIPGLISEYKQRAARFRATLTEDT